MNISGGQGPGSCGGRGGGRAGAEPCPSAWRCSECVRSQPMRARGGREKGLGGLQAGGLQTDAWQSGSHAQPHHHPVCPGYFHRLLTEARCQQPPRSSPLPPPRAPPPPCIAPLYLGGGGGEGNWGLVALQGAASNPGTPNPPCPPLAPGCASPSTTLPGACGISVRISLSFLPRAEQLIIYPIIKEETVNEMKTSQKHLLGLLSSPPRAACAGSGSGRGTGAPGGAAAAGGCPPHPAFLTAAPSSSRTPRPPWPSILSLLHH